MRSAQRADDRTARARIRDAAIRRFAAEGVAATTVREIAREAGVSAALVIHHFGSKDELRAACDAHIASVIRDRKQEAMAAGAGLDPLRAIRESGGDPPVVGYLARTLIDGSPQVVALVDELVADAESYLSTGEESGALRPSRDRRARAALLVLWSLGALVMHEHVQRLLGVDLTGPAEELGRPNPYVTAAIELFAEGLLTPEAASRYLASMNEQEEEVPT